ncbi:MAG: peptidylprolyl isomerase [Winogradskyella sp.]
MKTKSKIFLLLVVISSLSFSQIKDDVLLKIDGEPVMVSEFLRVYNKNLDLVKDESQKDIDAYLKLFTEYQLKLKEAKRLGLDKESKYINEFSNYKKQLTKNYLTESKVTDFLIKEAYQRSQLNVKASHVLIRLEETEKDTLKAYNEALALRNRILNEGFNTVKKNVHNGKTIFAEDLGYFSAFKMVYDFENVAYKTPVGEVSMPFRTQFGYHVVKVEDKKASKGTISVAHIMVGLKPADSLLDPKKRINDIYKKLNQGETFEALAKQFSDDKSSAKNGGVIRPFKMGQLSASEFETAAFALQNDGDVTQPFKTQFGWHIVKRIQLKPMESFEILKPTLATKVKRDSRSKLINEAMVNELKKRYTITYNPKAKAYFESILSKDFFSGTWKFIDKLKTNENVFTINNKAFTYKEFGLHLQTSQRAYRGKNMPVSAVFEKEFKAFLEKSIFKFREDNLQFENVEFANIVKEYRDGLLLFDLMENEIWKKAAKDTLGLQAYYNANKANYNWKDRVEVAIASSAKKAIIKAALKMLKKGKSEDNINAKFNTDSKQNIMFTNGTYATNAEVLPLKFKVKKGVSQIYKHNEAYHVINVKAILPAKTKTLEEAKGSVISDYQTQLETNWIKDLYSRFKIEVNEAVLAKVKAKIKN